MPRDPVPKSHHDLAIFLRELQARVDSLYADSPAEQFGLTHVQFTAALERSAGKRFAEGVESREKVQEYLEALHVEDLVLASACLEGSEAAWEHFVRTYRGYLRAAAGSITKGSRSGADAQEMADSLFAELFGLVDGKRGGASLFRYFHGRSSLKTWLRTILAQRHIDRLRQSHRWESLDKTDGEEERPLSPRDLPIPSPDPHRERYLQRFLHALTCCLDLLDAKDRKRLELYYAREKTLAEIGILLEEHESSASRHLERTRRELRVKVEECLRTGRHAGNPSRCLPPLSDAEISLCFEYASEEVPVDFRQIFPEKPSGRGAAGRKESS